MIEIKNLHKSFGEEKIFDDFSLTISQGEFVTVAGASGTGKTTLLNIIGALENYDEGEVLFKGKRIKTSKEKRLFWLNEAGFLFQNFALIENKTVKENLEIIKPSAMSDVSIDEALNKVGLINKKDKKVFTLSGGEQQRIAIARLFLKKCNLILADEPTGSLDRKNADIVMELIRDLNKQGKTVVLVTHDERIINSAERVIRL